MKVYISGKIGEEVISDATRLKFARAEAMLKAKGYEVFNPCDEKWELTLRRSFEKDRKHEEAWIDGTFPDFYTYALLRDQMVISTKDAVYFLDDFKMSGGAMSEFYFAMAVKKRILFANYLHGILFLEEDFDAKVNQGIIEIDLMKSYYKIREEWCIKNIRKVWLDL